MRFRLRTLLIVLAALAVTLLASAPALAIVTIELGTPHDKWSPADIDLASDKAKESTMLVLLMESIAVADRGRQREEISFPFNLEAQSREQVEARLGKPVERKTEDYARPAAGNQRLIPWRLEHGDEKGLMERAKFYALKDV